MIPNNFEQNFLIKKNFLIKVYIFVNNEKYNFILRYITKIIFNRVAFGLLKLNRQIKVNAFYKNKPFGLRSLNSQFHSLYFTEYKKNYEPEVNAVMNHYLKQGNVLVDIGSNWGHHSINAADEMKANVYAYEPNPYVYSDLENIKNDLNIKNLSIFNYGLGEFNAQVELSQNHFESGRVSLQDKKDLFLKFPEKILNFLTIQRPIKWTSEIKLLDEVYNGPKIDLIKIDIENGEYECLKGSKHILQNHKPKIILESDEHNFIKIRDFLKTFAYKIYKVRNENNKHYSLEPIEMLESRCNILASCEEI